MFAAIDRTSKFAIVRLYEQADRPTAVTFLQTVLEAVPYKINIILTPSRRLRANACRAMDNGIQFAEQPRNRNTVISRLSRFDMICNANEIEHRLTKPNHPWSHEDQKTIRGIVFLNGGQVERIPLTVCGQTVAGQRNRTIKEATVQRYHYDDHEQLRRHLDLFVDTYNHARRLKTLKGLTPAQFIWKQWQSNPELFYEDPCHLTSGLYT